MSVTDSRTFHLITDHKIWDNVLSCEIFGRAYFAFNQFINRNISSKGLTVIPSCNM